MYSFCLALARVIGTYKIQLRCVLGWDWNAFKRLFDIRAKCQMKPPVSLLWNAMQANASMPSYGYLYVRAISATAVAKRFGLVR